MSENLNKVKALQDRLRGLKTVPDEIWKQSYADSENKAFQELSRLWPLLTEEEKSEANSAEDW